MNLGVQRPKQVGIDRAPVAPRSSLVQHLTRRESVYLTSIGGALYAVHAKDGRLVRKAALPGHPRSSPTWRSCGHHASGNVSATTDVNAMDVEGRAGPSATRNDLDLIALFAEPLDDRREHDHKTRPFPGWQRSCPGS